MLPLWIVAASFAHTWKKKKTLHCTSLCLVKEPPEAAAHRKLFTSLLSISLFFALFCLLHINWNTKMLFFCPAIISLCFFIIFFSLSASWSLSPSLFPYVCRVVPQTDRPTDSVCVYGFFYFIYLFIRVAFVHHNPQSSVYAFACIFPSDSELF